jgi:hypothetical protein
MTKIRLNTFLLVTLVISSKVIATPCSSLAHLNWLIGEWQTDNSSNFNKEVWRKISNKTFEGQGKTNTSSESLRIIEMSNEIFYLAKVAHNLMPIAFKLVDCKDKHSIFENMLHDFPNKIEYRQIDNNTMQVKVSENSKKSFTIQLYRVQNNNKINKK